MAMIPHRGRSGPFPASYLERLYAMPRPTLWLHEWQRERNLDLGAMDDLALHRERRCVQRRLDYEPDVSRQTWLEQRLAAIDRERRSRQSQPPPSRQRGSVGTSTVSIDNVVTVAGQAVALPTPGGRRGYE